MKLFSTTKVNLFLDVIKRNPDGYHEILTIYHELEFGDIIYIEESKNFILESNIETIEKNNTIERAIKLIQKKYRIEKNYKVKLIKRVPIGGGLGGGSSDAAEVIKFLNKDNKLNLSINEMEKIGAEIGCDVPFFIQGGTQIGTHYGEILEKLSFNKEMYFILIYPEISISTQYAYSLLDPGIFRRGIKKFDRIIKGIKEGDIEEVYKNLYNIFERVIFCRYKRLKEIKESLLVEGASGALMSGSGSTIFGLFLNRKIAEKAYRRLKKVHNVIILCKSKMRSIQWKLLI